MKKLLIALAIILGLIIAALAILPMVFRDDIKMAIDDQIDQNLNAQVYYDVDNLSLSLFSHFPSLSVSMDEFGIVGVEEFGRDTLVSVQSFELALNLFSLFGDKIGINGVYLDQPRIKVLVLENGRANYDIAKAGQVEEPTQTSTSSGIEIGIDHWEIIEGQVIYDDRTMPLYTRIDRLNHTGSGDFGSTLFDMVTHTSIGRFDMVFDGVEYMSNKQIGADLTLGVDLDKMKFTFKENNILVNDFALGFDGSVEMPADDILIDLTFGAQETAFKSVLSLVPGVFLEGFEDLKTSGEFAFDGHVKGTYNETGLPAFKLNLNVSKGMFQYPDLPTAINNIGGSILVDNKDGIVENTMISIAGFHMDLGSNPIDATMLIKNLRDYDMNADIKASLNLSELADMFPMGGLTMKGDFNLDLKASGVYDSMKQTIPTVDMSMVLKDGYIKYDEYPIPMENMHMAASVTNETGQMANTLISVDEFGMLLDGEPVEASMTLENLNDYTWDVAIHGGVDLEKVMKIFPQDGMELSGKIKADVDSKGKMSDLESERYNQLTTSGNMTVSELNFVSADLPQGFKINSAQASFNPEQIQLTQFDALLGKSDMRVNGALSNYIAFILGQNETLKGNVHFKSNSLDLNEWMTEEEATVSEEEDTIALEVVKVPENVDFLLISTIDQVLYDNLTLNDVSGDLVVRNGSLHMRNVNFNMLDGEFALNGSYTTKNLDNPKFDFDFEVEQLSIAKSYLAMDMMQAMAPIAKNMTGDFSSQFKIDGSLDDQMMPIYESLNGGGLIQVAQAALKDVKILKAISSVANLGGESMLGGTVADIRDVIMEAEFKSGRLHINPFDINLGGRQATVSGSNGVDGSLDYVISTVVPAGAAGEAVNKLLSSFTGGSDAVGSDVNLNLSVTGSYDDPKVGIAGAKPTGASGSSKAQAQQVVQQKKEEVKDQAKQELKQQTNQAEQKLKEQANQKVQNLLKDSTLSAPVDDAKDLIKGLFNKKKKEGGGR